MNDIVILYTPKGIKTAFHGSDVALIRRDGQKLLIAFKNGLPAINIEYPEADEADADFDRIYEVMVPANKT